MEKGGCVYIMASKKNGVIYIGVTSLLPKRNYEHKNNITKGFAWKYNCKLLVYYEMFGDIETAIAAEKKFKNLSRAKKIEMIERNNPEWDDLSNQIA